MSVLHACIAESGEVRLLGEEFVAHEYLQTGQLMVYLVFDETRRRRQAYRQVEVFFRFAAHGRVKLAAQRRCLHGRRVGALGDVYALAAQCILHVVEHDVRGEERCPFLKFVALEGAALCLAEDKVLALPQIYDGIIVLAYDGRRAVVHAEPFGVGLEVHFPQYRHFPFLAVVGAEILRAVGVLVVVERQHRPHLQVIARGVGGVVDVPD